MKEPPLDPPEDSQPQRELQDFDRELEVPLTNKELDKIANNYERERKL